MLKVEISEEAYSQALKAATAREMSLAAYLESLIGRAVQIEEDFDSVFISGSFAYLDASSEQIELGTYRTAEQVQAEMEATEQAWRQRTAL
jgi:hypothetical protein